MLIEEVKIGMIVCIVDERESTGVVKTLPDADGMFTITWTYGSNVDGEDEEVNVRDFRAVDPEAEVRAVLQVQSKLNEATSLFEKAFQVFQEAQEVIYHYELDLYQLRKNGVISTKELEGTIESGGWSSSSLWCR
jgi:hypothetical protein